MINFARVQQNIVRFSYLKMVYSFMQASFDIFIRSFKIENQIASSNYWSSSANVSDSSNAWIVNFNSGNTNNNNKSNKYYVRCVRGSR
ncbi:MAG: DUF1566 domain-containing protein [Sulfurimonas sp.]|nr:DUF1566 domain-containing protein [Sulfurimonas sp.]